MQKKPMILIICGAVVILAIILLIVYLAKGGSTDIADINPGKNTQQLEAPVVTLSAYPEEETDGDVEISVLATIGAGHEIVSLTTPDGRTTGYTPDRKYTVSENGEYSFIAKANNGQETTATITINNISKLSADNPYIPDGFKHIEGTEVDTGFVIEDESGNQYVWVPVESGTPTRVPPSDKYYEDDYTASSLTNSVAKYYGFYIARYEASKDTVNGIVVAKSVSGEIPWSNVTYDDANSAAKNTADAYNYIGVKTALINSYAWDTALSWINTTTTNYSTSRTYGNYSNKILATGETDSDIVNEISDMAGNLREWTTERYGNDLETDEETGTDTDADSNTDSEETNSDEEILFRVVRGGSATMDKIANSRIGERTDLKDNYWGFRMILYKD